ncbi:MAG: hypothetical protein RBR15_11625 [Sphaerochaeta sp.]|nr:hypothetical protein [Sphaerochaeta sp.]
MVFVMISFIQCLQSVARELFALKTEPDQTLRQQIAKTFHIGAVLAPWYAAYTAFPMAALFMQIVVH